MKIHLHTLCWNDAAMLPFFFRHYDPWIDRYFIYDDGSTDASLGLLAAHPKVELHLLPPRPPGVTAFVRCIDQFNQGWKRSKARADWVVVTEIDEHLQHPDMKSYLARARQQGVTAIPALGFQMMSERFPDPGETLTQSITKGAADEWYSKLSIFSPNDITEINYALGRHTASPEGKVILPPEDEMLLLHYKYLGFENLIARQQQIFKQHEKDIVESGLGVHIAYSREKMEEIWEQLKAALVDLNCANPSQLYTESRWWNNLPRVASPANNES